MDMCGEVSCPRDGRASRQGQCRVSSLQLYRPPIFLISPIPDIKINRLLPVEGVESLGKTDFIKEEMVLAGTIH